MTVIRLIGRNVSRHKYKSILHILIGVFIVLILDIYAGNMERTEQELARLPEALPVSARISSLNGSMRECLAIREDRVMGIRESEYVKDPVFTVRLKFGFGEFTLEEYKENLNHYGRGMNALSDVFGLGREQITFLEGVDESVLETSQKVCLMEEALMEARGLRRGDDVMLTTYYYRCAPEGSEVFIEPLVTDTYRIVGSMLTGDYRGEWMPPEVILPFDCVREAYRSQGIAFFADSGSFMVKDPFQLNALKAQMYNEVRFLPVITRALPRYDGNALTIMDEAFIRSAETLLGNIELLRRMFPFLVSILIFIGYLCSYLSLQSRQEEYALMRSLGTGRGRSFLLLFGETAFLAAAACVSGSFAALFLFRTKAVVLVLSAALFLLTFLLGTAVALIAFHRLSVMQVLTRKD
ncbi:MAG: hypothetical protein K2K90_02970 [Lachnospiraceae bacterium]|nr:hypothetical protein [Lachnospiraceae bacterium]